jgi:alginate O-acetyltransferase complex protein AlgI
MLFHGPLFLFLFLPLAVALYWLAAARPALRTLALCLAGAVFYGAAAGLAPLALLLALSVVTYGGAAASTGAAAPRPVIGLAVLVLDLAVLAAFKLGEAASAGALLPLGLSFYTFNLVSYAVDVRRGQGPTAASWLALASYATFFPIVSSGPLVRYGDFQRQQAAPPRFDALLVESGVVRLIVGLAKKLLVADPLGLAVEPLFAGYERLGLVEAWLAVLGYAYQLYFDFSGYTDMAIGAAALLGFRIPENFNAPYTALHITDFWQRWHMTMSRWFRDYLFLPLSRALLRRRSSLAGAERVRALCLVLTMVVIGAWHGSSWSFLAWGLFHGLLLAGHAQARTMLRLSLPAWASRALTFLAVLAGWVLLRSPSPGMALTIWGAMLGTRGLADRVGGPSAGLAAAIGLLLVATNAPVEAYLLGSQRRPLRSWALAALLAISLLSLGGRSPFLYFQF